MMVPTLEIFEAKSCPVSERLDSQVVPVEMGPNTMVYLLESDPLGTRRAPVIQGLTLFSDFLKTIQGRCPHRQIVVRPTVFHQQFRKSIA